MVPDLTLEVIYLNEPTDFKMEFELCSSLNVRFLSLPVKSRSEFLTAMSKSVVRSRTIIAVGSFNPLDKLYIPQIIAKATGYELEIPQNENLKINSNVAMPLPKGSLPLVDEKGNLCGCVLENNDQSIIMLTSDRELRFNVVKNLVCPYLTLFAQKKTKEFNSAVLSDASAPVKPEPENSSVLPVDDNAQTAPVMDQEQSTANESNEKSVEAVDNEALQVAEFTEPEPAEPQIEEQELAEPEQINEPVSAENSDLKETESSNSPKYFIVEQPDQIPAKPLGLDEFLIEDDVEKNSNAPKKAKAFLKIVISIILVLAVALASYFGYDRLFQPMQHASVYDEVKALYGQKWSELPENMFYKFGKLYQTNSDVFGWLSLPDTTINLPVVSSAKKSATYYRTHLFDGSVNRYGTLYTTSQLSAADYNRNLLIYGKNMGDGTMFSELENFLDIDIYKNAPSFTFDTLYFENKWKIFSVFKVNSKNRNSYLKTNFFDDEEFLNYLEKIKGVSAIKTNIDVTYTDQIVTLVSLGETNDVILVARKVRDGESPMVDVTGTYENYITDNSSDIPVIAEPLEPLDTSSNGETTSNIVDQNMVDGASSRYEQQAPVSSAITIKPTVPTVSSVPEISSSKPSSSKPTSSKNSSTTTTSKVPSSSSAISSKPTSSAITSSGSTVANNLPMLTVTNTFNGEKVKGNALDIIAQNVEAEMGSSYHIEALKAQAVAAYSWLLNNGSANNKYPSLPLKKPSQKSIDAVNAVAGQVAVYNGKVATTYYYAISAGKTAYAQNIWSSAIPYCVSVDSSVDKNVSGYQTVRKYSSEKVAEIAKELLGVDLTKTSDKTKWFSCSYDVNGLYCTKVKIGTAEKKGTYLRDTFFNASRVGASNVLRSSAYTIAYNESEDVFIFTVKGYGHGVGMSQAGANQYAKNGWTYDEILKHYFTGISLGNYYI